MTEQSESRSQTLLLAAAEALDDGRDPLSHAFLVEHEVTFDECGTLGDQLGLAARPLVNIQRKMLQGGPEGRVAALLLAEAADLP